jgi:hypothetical protein
MANSMAEWLLTLFPWAHSSTEPTVINNPGLEKLQSESIAINSRESISRCSSPEEEIIKQMAKEHPLLFIT